MHRTIQAVLAAISLATAAAAAADETPLIQREGGGTGVTMGSAASKRMEQGKDQAVMSWDFIGVSLADDGKGILHNASVRCIGAAHTSSGAIDGFLNACTFTRPDGDQIFSVERYLSGKPGGASTGTATLVGGTGKMAGITGGSEWTRSFVRAAAEGTFQTVTRSKMTYKLP